MGLSCPSLLCLPALCPALARRAGSPAQICHAQVCTSSEGGEEAARGAAGNGAGAGAGGGRAAPQCLPFDPTVPGSWCPWSEWTMCTQPCRGQMRTRSRACTCPAPQHGGSPCPGEAGKAGVQHQREPCASTPACPGEAPPLVGSNPSGLGPLAPLEADSWFCLPATVDGAWSPWGPWSPCDVCLGQSHRSRACNWPPTPEGGRPCPGSYRQSRLCWDNSTQCTGEDLGRGLEGSLLWLVRGCL